MHYTLVKMDFTIIKENENLFFKRKEMIIEIIHTNAATLSKAEIIKTIGTKNSVDESQVIIEFIRTKKGIAESIAKIKILKEKLKEQPKKEAKQGETVEAQTSQAA